MALAHSIQRLHLFIWVHSLGHMLRNACACCRSSSAARSADLLRLGFLMALTMTLHNAPEGFAVSPKCPISYMLNLRNIQCPMSSHASAVHGLPLHPSFGWLLLSCIAGCLET